MLPTPTLYMLLICLEGCVYFICFIRLEKQTSVQASTDPTSSLQYANAAAAEASFNEEEGITMITRFYHSDEIIAMTTRHCHINHIITHNMC